MCGHPPMVDRPHHVEALEMTEPEPTPVTEEGDVIGPPPNPPEENWPPPPPPVEPPPSPPAVPDDEDDA